MTDKNPEDDPSIKESIEANRRIAKREAELKKKELQHFNTGGYVPKRMPVREPLPPEKLQEMMDNHSEILKKHEPNIQKMLKHLQKTRS